MVHKCILHLPLLNQILQVFWTVQKLVYHRCGNMISECTESNDIFSKQDLVFWGKICPTTSFSLLKQPFLIGNIWPPMEACPGTCKGRHRLETILCAPPYKVRYVTSTILIWPIFLSYCVYGHGQKKRLRMASLESKNSSNCVINWNPVA